MKKIFISSLMLTGVVALAQNTKNVGINTTTPQAKLEVKGDGNSNTTKAFRITDNTGKENLTVLDNGNVGIGTANPLKLLTISNTAPLGFGSAIDIYLKGGILNSSYGNYFRFDIDNTFLKPDFFGNQSFVAITTDRTNNFTGRLAGSYQEAANLSNVNIEKITGSRTVTRNMGSGIVNEMVGMEITGGLADPTSTDSSLGQTSNALGGIIHTQYGIKIYNIHSGTKNYAIHTSAGQIRIGDLASTVTTNTAAAEDRPVFATADGVLKVGSASGTQIATAPTPMVCDASNLGKMNFGKVTINGNQVDAFGFCMRKDDNTTYTWAYIVAGSNIYNSTNVTFGQGL